MPKDEPKDTTDKERAAAAEAAQQDTTADADRQAAKAEAEAAAKKDPKQMKEALKAFGLKREEVLDFRAHEDTLVIVTRGGRKLTYPEDVAKAGLLSPEEKDGVARKPAPSFFTPTPPPPAPGSGLGRN